jgi:hypothetical protein
VGQLENLRRGNARCVEAFGIAATARNLLTLAVYFG